MININILDEYSSYVNPEIMNNVCESALKIIYSGIEVDLSIVITSDLVSNDLNLRFRGIDSPTDVLSFSSNEIDPDNGHRYIGDIIISLPRVVEQAKLASHPLENEIYLLLVHGLLHLFGYDHSTKEEEKNMWDKQNLILSNLGYS